MRLIVSQMMVSVRLTSELIQKASWGAKQPVLIVLQTKVLFLLITYAEQICNDGRTYVITGQSVFRTGLSKVSLTSLRIDIILTLPR